MSTMKRGRRARDAGRVDAPRAFSTPADHPLAKVEWVDPELLRANDYNPNHVAPPEMALLKVSIIENGWTQPIVVRDVEDGKCEIVDGFHRWTLGQSDPDIRALSGGLVPVVRLVSVDPVTQRMATIRHNRARGTHAVVKMAEIVNALEAMGESDKEIGIRLGMEADEIKRLKTHGSMRQHGATLKEFHHGWVPGTVDEQKAALADINRDDTL